MTTNHAIIFNKVPEGMPENGTHLILKDIGIDLSIVPSEGAIMKVKFASFDPYLRGRMRNKSEKSYFDAFDLDAPIETLLVGEIISSSSERLAVGQIVRTFGPLQEYL